MRIVRNVTWSRWTTVAALLLAFAGACKADRSAELEKRVEAALRSEPAFTQVNVVSAHRGIVTLAGHVRSDGDRAHLDDVVRQVAGVVAVDDRSVLVPAPPIVTPATPEAILAASIVSRLRAADLRGLDVAVHDRTVRVTGSVPRDRHADALRIVVDSAPRYRIEDASVETDHDGT